MTQSEGGDPPEPEPPLPIEPVGEEQLPTPPAPAGPAHAAAPRGAYLAALSLGALGVVYGDIGTSPLYAIREVFLDEHDVGVTPANILGVLSLVFWALVIIVSLKYLVFILRADNRGEGGILALTSLVTPVGATQRGGRSALILLGLFGTALLCGEGMITPAITVLSAVEGLGVATHVFDPFIIPITIAILVGVFSVQRRGTARVGRIFGPVTLVWFATLAALGISWIVRSPSVFRAINPLYGVRFFLENGWKGLLVLGSVVLVVTGAEALYADMGHFGTRPIRLAWFAIVLPALLLNYFGQGALLMVDPGAVENPFYHMVPNWGIYPAVIIATAASVIASQALISGAFSIARQAVQLGYSPRLDIHHTSSREIGQIYVPAVNWMLMVAGVALVLGFGSSTHLAAAYGLAVTTTMVVTTLLFAVVARERWGWGLPSVIAVAGMLLVIDLSFWGANLLKIPRGGWFPLLVGAGIFTLFTTWKTGRRVLAERLRTRTLPRELFLADVENSAIPRVPGTAVFMYGSQTGTPPALLHSMKHYGVLHETVVFLAVVTEEVPFVRDEERVDVKALGSGVFQVTIRSGFMEDVDVPHILGAIQFEGLTFKPMSTSYFLGRETLIPSKRPGMAIWRERLFSVMTRNARSASTFFRLPPNRVVELGAQIEL